MKFLPSPRSLLITLLTDALFGPTLVLVLMERASSAIGKPGIAVPYVPSATSGLINPNRPPLIDGVSMPMLALNVGDSETTGVSETTGGATERPPRLVNDARLSFSSGALGRTSRGALAPDRDWTVTAGGLRSAGARADVSGAAKVFRTLENRDDTRAYEGCSSSSENGLNDVSVRSSCRVGRPRDAPDVDPFGDCTHDGPSTDILSIAVELSAPRPRGGWVQLIFLPVY